MLKSTSCTAVWLSVSAWTKLKLEHLGDISSATERREEKRRGEDRKEDSCREAKRRLREKKAVEKL